MKIYVSEANESHHRDVTTTTDDDDDDGAEEEEAEALNNHCARIFNQCRAVRGR